LAFLNNQKEIGAERQDERIHSPENLKLILQEERARSNRNKNEFSFILFDLKNLRNDGSMISRFIRTLTGRVRAIDKVGWMEDLSVGVVLPSTPSPGARILAEEIVRTRGTGDHWIIPYTIYTYPYTMYGI
jgi:hypothetical protein